MKEKYKYVLALPLIAMVAFGAYTFGSATVLPGDSAPQGIGYTGMVCPTVVRADGSIEDLGCSHNILFLVGKNFTTSQLFDSPSAAGATPVSNISLGNGTSGVNQIYTAANFGGIPDCGLDPYDGAEFDWINIPNATAGYIDASGNVSANKKWTSTCSGATGVGERVNQTLIGLTTNAFALNAFTDVYLQANDQLNVTWYVWIT